MTGKARITRRSLVAGAVGFGGGVLIVPGINARAYAANEKLNPRRQSTYRAARKTKQSPP